MRYLSRPNFSKILANKWLVIFFGLVLITLIINSLHYTYPDEYDNIVGGFFIDHGRLPYIGFFTHHGPTTYFLASIITIFTGNSFVKFRILLNFVYFLSFLGFFIYTAKRFGQSITKVTLPLISLLAIGATYYWGHMLLSDVLAGYLILPAYILVFLNIYHRQKPTLSDNILISALSAAALLTSVTYVYAIFILYLYSFFWIFYGRNFRLLSKITLKNLAIFAAPWLVFLIYLVITGSLYDYYYQSIFFNLNYYIPGASGSPVSNPIRQAITIFHTILDLYTALIIQIKDFNFGFPFNATLALSNVALLTYLLLNRRFKLALMVFGLLIFLNARSNPLSSQETDYQAIPYDFFSFFNGLFVIHTFWEKLQQPLSDARKAIYTLLLLLLGVYFMFLFLFLFNKGFDKAFQKYMGNQSLIYDRPLLATVLNKLLTPQDYFYVGPFAFEEYLYINAKPASRYFITIPAMDRSPKIKSELLADIDRTQPKIIVFDTEYFILGGVPGLFLLDHIKPDYFTLDQLKAEGQAFTIYNNVYGNYFFDRHFFFRRDHQAEVIKQLVDNHLITPPTASKSAVLNLKKN